MADKGNHGAVMVSIHFLVEQDNSINRCNRATDGVDNLGPTPLRKVWNTFN
jgi:hypothetical protein